jgi:hypothetical protein
MRSQLKGNGVKWLATPVSALRASVLVTKNWDAANLLKGWPTDLAEQVPRPFRQNDFFQEGLFRGDCNSYQFRMFLTHSDGTIVAGTDCVTAFS